MSKKFNPRIGTSIASVGEVFEAIKDPSYIRDTTRVENLKRGSTVTRSMGYQNLFETFQDKGINKVTINKFKNIPEITDYLDKDGKLNDTKLNKYNKDLKKFRLDAFKGLSPKDIKTIESSGFLSQFAKDQRLKIINSGGKFNQKNLNKVLDQMFDFTFKDLDTAVGVNNPKIQDKKITDAMNKVNANKNISAAQKLNIKFGLSQVDKLVKMGNSPAARKLLTAIITLAPKGLFGMDLLIPTEMGSGELPKEGTPEYEQLMKDMGKNQGGMMDINYMTRPLGYKEGTREGTTVGDLEKLTNFTRANIQDAIAKNVKGQLNEAELKAISDSIPDTLELLKLGPPPVGSMARVTDLLKTVSDTFGQLNEKEKEMIKGESQDPSVTAIDTLRSLAASEVYNSMMNKEGVDSFKIASAFLRNQGIPTNDQSMNAIINLLDSQIIPQEQLKLMKEGQSDLGKGMDAVARGAETVLSTGARGIENLLSRIGVDVDLPEFRKFRDMDRDILKELKDMRTN